MRKKGEISPTAETKSIWTKMGGRNVRKRGGEKDSIPAAGGKRGERVREGWRGEGRAAVSKTDCILITHYGYY